MREAISEGHQRGSSARVISHYAPRADEGGNQRGSSLTGSAPALMREAISEGHHSQDRPPRVLSKGDDSEMLVDAPLDGTQAIMLLIKHQMREAIR